MTPPVPDLLKGIRVLDMSRVLAGPWATQLLADLGAEVIKVEEPDKGDDTRRWGPPFVKPVRDGADPIATYYLCTNRGKKSVTIDIRTPEGQGLILDLARQCDVLVENFKVGGLGSHGLDYASVKVVRPDIVYCSVTGFGQTGPLKNLPGYDLVVQAMGGLMSVTGPAEGEPGSAPMRAGVAVADQFTAMYASTAILGALFARTRTGEGQHIDLALLDVQVAMLANHAAAALATGIAPKRTGNAHTAIVPYQPFVVADGEMIIAVGNDSQFASLCELMGVPELAADPAFATNAARVRSRDRLIPRLAKVLLTRTRSEWTEALRAKGVPCGPIQDVVEALSDLQVRARGMVREYDHPDAGAISLVSSPINYSGAPTTSPMPPPTLGQHTDEVLSEVLGKSTEEVAALRASRVV